MNNSTCKYCNKEFKYHKTCSSGIYCSWNCYILDNRIKTKRCVICGKKYTPDKGTARRWNKSKYCCLMCLNIGKKTGKFVKCSICGKQLWRTPKSIVKQRHFFCCRKCFGKWQELHFDGTNVYKQGYYAEREAMTYLKNRGYHVIRSGRSIGAFDLVAVRFGRTRLIQVKSTHRAIYTFPKKDMDNTMMIDTFYPTTKELWIKYIDRGWEFYNIDNGELMEIIE